MMPLARKNFLSGYVKNQRSRFIGRDRVISRHAYPKCPFPRLYIAGVIIGVVIQFAGVLSGENDAARHHPEPERHPVNQFRQ